MAVKVTAKNVDRLQHVAVSRLTLFVSGRIASLFGDYQTWLTDQVRKATDADGLNTAALSSLLPTAGTRWKRVVNDYTALLKTARDQAGDIAFASLRMRHNAYITGPIEHVEEAFQPAQADWLKLVEMWTRRRNYALQVAQQRTWSDGLNLSQRIWRLDNGGMQRIRSTIAAGMANRTSAVDLVAELESQLGANMDMPRWTHDRLNIMTPADRAQDGAGLLTDPEQRAKGISYNALRLARNEIQYANHAVTSDIAQHFPGIVGRKVRLSPEHPKSDICDGLAAGGPYPVTDELLPAHAQCLCHYEEVMMAPTDFARKVGEWVRGDSDFLDDYASWLGVRSFAPIPVTLPVLKAMDLWLDNDVDAMAQVIRL